MSLTKASFLLLLKLRYSSPLFRLPSAVHIQRQLHFHNTGPHQVRPFRLIWSIFSGCKVLIPSLFFYIFPCSRPYTFL